MWEGWQGIAGNITRWRIGVGRRGEWHLLLGGWHLGHHLDDGIRPLVHQVPVHGVGLVGHG